MFVLIQEDIETYILFAISPLYFILLSIIQTKHLRKIKLIKSNLASKEQKNKATYEIKRLLILSPFILLIGLAMHSIVYSIIANDNLRLGYFLSIFFFYFIFLLIAWINFWLKGSSILKDTGDFGGLPG